MSPSNRPPSHPWRWFPEFFELSQRRLRSQSRLMGLSLIVGFVAGLGAIVFFAACQVVFHFTLDMLAGYHPNAPGGEPALFDDSATVFRPYLLLLIPLLGGILSGWIVYRFAPEAEGHGTDAAIAAYHYHQGYIRPRVPLIKIVASALTLGTGGSGGREGPIAQIGAGFGFALGRLLHLRPAERRILMAAGMGAGVAAIFRAPLAGALFAAEVLYRSPDFESEVIIPAGLASVIAYCTFGLAFGWLLLFSLPVEDATESLPRARSFCGRDRQDCKHCINDRKWRFRWRLWTVYGHWRMWGRSVGNCPASLLADTLSPPCLFRDSWHGGILRGCGLAPRVHAFNLRYFGDRRARFPRLSGPKLLVDAYNARFL